MQRTFCFIFTRDGSSGGGGGGRAILTRWWVASLVCSFLVSGVVHEAVAFVAMRRTFWPINTFFLCVAASMTPVWDALFPVIAAANGLPDHDHDHDPSSVASRSSSPPSVAAVAAAAAADGRLPVAGAETPEKAAPVAAATSKAAAPPPPPASPAEEVMARRRNGGAPAPNGSAILDQQGHDGATTASKDSPKLDVGVGGDVNRPEEGCGREGSEPPAPSSSGRRGGAARSKMGSWRGWMAVVFYAGASVPATLAVDYLVWQWWRHTFLVE